MGDGRREGKLLPWKRGKRLAPRLEGAGEQRNEALSPPSPTADSSPLEREVDRLREALVGLADFPTRAYLPSAAAGWETRPHH